MYYPNDVIYEFFRKSLESSDFHLGGPTLLSDIPLAGGNRPVVLHRFKHTNDVKRHAYESTNGVRRDASRLAAPGGPAVVNGRAQLVSGFVALL